MFSNFKNTFAPTPRYMIETPKVVLDAISEDLPKGFYYVHDHDGVCRASTLEGFNLESISIQLSVDAKKALPAHPTLENVITYAYNSQSYITFLPDKDGNYTVNGKPIKATDLIKAPLKEINFKEVRIVLRPQQFPVPFKLKISGEEYEDEIYIKRIPNNSLTVQKYESDNERMLSIGFEIDSNDIKKLDFSINVNREKAKSAEEIVKGYHIYNAFMDGHGKINDMEVSTDGLIESDKISVDTIRFWEMVLEIQRHLDIKFNNFNDVTAQDIKSVKKLYRCLLEEKPYKEYKQYTSVTGIGNIEECKNEMINEEREISFDFISEITIALFDTPIKLSMLHAIFGAAIKSKEDVTCDKDGNFKIALSTYPQRKMYEAVMLFSTMEELTKFRELSNYIKLMESATEIL